MVRMLGPVEITTEDPANFRAETRYVDLGAVQVAAIMASPCKGIRATKMIRQSDPALFRLILPFTGTTVIAQDSARIAVGPRDMALYGTSHPWRIGAGGDEGLPRGAVAVFPYALLPFPPERVRRALTFYGREGIGALLAGFLTRVAAGPGRYGTTDGRRLGTILADLVAAQLAHRFDADDALHGDTHQRTLLLKIHAFNPGAPVRSGAHTDANRRRAQHLDPPASPALHDRGGDGRRLDPRPAPRPLPARSRRSAAAPPADPRHRHPLGLRGRGALLPRLPRLLRPESAGVPLDGARRPRAAR